MSASEVAAHEAKPGLLQRYLPILQWLPGYQRTWFTPDAVAALSVWALLIPQSLGYATLAGVPVQYGLYAAFVALIAYAIFGTSRQMAQGPSGAVAAVSAAVIGPIVGTEAMGTEKAVGYTAALALVTGGIYLLLGLLRMGWISNFLSKAVLGGFVLGFAIGIIIDQSAKLLGVNRPSGSYVEELVGTIKALPETQPVTLAVGTASLAALLLMRRFLSAWPRALIVMALSILAVQAFNLADEGVAVTGPVPTGLFSIGLPGVGWSELGALVAGALSVVFVGYSESLASARAMALKHGYEIDPDQELIAQGAACGTAGFVGGFATDGSLSKTSVADLSGQKTQMASLVNALFVLLTMLFLASLFENLPQATLGAVVIDAMLGMVTFGPMWRYFHVNRADWLFFVGAMAGILFIDIIHGILIGVILSLLLLVARASKPGVRRLGREPKLDVWVASDRYSGLELVPGVLAVRMGGPLFFADANRFRDALNELIASNQGPVRALVVDATAISQTDTDGADIVIQIAGDLRSRGISLAFAHLERSILELWTRAGVLEALGPDRIFETVRDAVHTLQASEPATPATTSTS